MCVCVCVCVRVSVVCGMCNLGHFQYGVQYMGDVM